MLQSTARDVGVLYRVAAVLAVKSWQDEAHRADWSWLTHVARLQVAWYVSRKGSSTRSAQHGGRRCCSAYHTHLDVLYGYQII